MGCPMSGMSGIGDEKSVIYAWKCPKCNKVFEATTMKILRGKQQYHEDIHKFRGE